MLSFENVGLSYGMGPETLRDLTFSIEGREGIVDAGELTARGAFGNLPCGEGFIAPVEGTAEGTLVVDGSIAAIGLVESPVKLTIEGGHLVGATGDEGAQLMELLTPHGPGGTNVAELGIGTVAVYAAQRTAGGVLTLVVVNKATEDVEAPLTLQQFPHRRAAQVYRTTGDGVANVGTVDVGSTGFTATYPARSVTLIAVKPR